MYAVKDNESVLEAIKNGTITAGAASYPNLVDRILLSMNNIGVLPLMGNSLEERRADNARVPLHILLSLAVAAKMKLKTSLSDIPFAIQSANTLASFGYNLYDQDRGLEEGLMSEGTIRNFVAKYDAHDFIDFYNNFIKEQLFPHQNIAPNIHSLDCTYIKVSPNNENYENSATVSYKGELIRGYKMASLRGIVGDTGVIEEIKLDSSKPHDLELSRSIILESPHLKPGDILINDRGFLSRDILNLLKTDRGVDTYMPLKKNMEAYKMAVSLAEEKGKWYKHPNKKQKKQRVALVKNLGPFWESNKADKDVDFNAGVVHDQASDEYFVFITTDLSQTAKKIVATYELRTEIEEDFRQLKDFWQLENFTSTKFNVIAFHIVMLLMGYLFFQVYTTTDEGYKYCGKTLPVAAKNYTEEGPTPIIIYAGHCFGIFSFWEAMQLVMNCSDEIRAKMKPILSRI